MTATVPEKAENKYRLAIGWALPPARNTSDEADDAYTLTQAALQAHAWESTVADAFSGVCVAMEAAAGRAADDCVGTLEARHSSEPLEVDRSDRRASWS